VIHRDVKPQNLMIDQSGRVLITDFGISKALQADTQYTSTGEMVGTPSYLSPEQAQSLPVDGRSDQYSLACVGYRMVVGHLPLQAESVHGMLYKHIYETPTPARLANPAVPADLSEALQRALAKDPAERFASMEEFAAAVTGQTGPAAAGAEEPTPAVQRPAPRRLILAVVLAILMVGATGVALWRMSHRAEQLPMESAKGQPAPVPPAPVPDSSTATAPTVPPAPPDTSPAAAPPELTPKPEVARVDTIRKKPVGETARPKRAPARPAIVPRPERPGGETGVPAPAKVGYLTVNAVPYGTVSIDGVEAGDTPIVGRELTPGPHQVRITREGFRPEVATVTITVGNEVRLSRTLVRAP
jgi:hypothetical protein